MLYVFLFAQTFSCARHVLVAERISARAALFLSEIRFFHGSFVRCIVNYSVFFKLRSAQPKVQLTIRLRY